MARFPAATAIALCLLSLSVGAAEVPSAEDIAAQLTGGATRSFTPYSDRGITNTGGGREDVAAIDLTINFEFNSAVLSRDGLVLVGNLGRALKDPRLAGKRFSIEGHTDAVGGDAFNQRLSEQRAAAVRQSLVRGYGIAADRVQAVGYGKTRLLDPAQPESGRNRRVRVVNLGPAR